MIAPIYQHPNPSHALQDAMRDTWVHMNKQEGWLDSKGLTHPQGATRYAKNIMEGVALAVDLGGCSWIDKKAGTSKPVDPNQSSLFEFTNESPRETEARMVADLLGYDSVSNCAAMFREAMAHGLLTAEVVDECGWVMATDYGLEILDRWEKGSEYD